MDQWIWDIGYAIGGAIIAALTASGHISKMKVYLKDAIDFLMDNKKCIETMEKMLANLYEALEDNKLSEEEMKELVSEVKLTISNCKPIFQKTGHYEKVASELKLRK